MDYSFIRFKPNFNQAKQMLDPKHSQFRYYDCISLHPLETYLQITGSEVDIVFNNSYKASIIDCNENELKDITANVSIYEALDFKGVRQIAFEIVNIGQSWYGMPVFLKLESTINTEIKFYSNAFSVTDLNTEDTFRLNYKSYGFYQGTDYKNFNYFQSIRLKGNFTITSDETENSMYIQTDGRVLSQNPTIVFSENWIFPDINNFAFRSLSIALKSDLVYLDLNRVTDKPQIKNSAIDGRSNLSIAETTLHRDLDTYFSDVNQITITFAINYKYPSSYITLVIASTNTITAIFNKPIVLGTSGIMRIYQVGGFLKATLFPSDFNVVDNSIQSVLPISDYISEYGDFYITFTTDFVKSTINEDISILNNEDWTFKIGRGDFKNSDFKNTDFLIYT